MITGNVGPSWPAHPEFGDLVVTADGRKVDQVDTPALISQCQRLGVGFVESCGRDHIVRAFAAQRASVFNQAGHGAVAQWLKGKS